MFTTPKPSAPKSLYAQSHVIANSQKVWAFVNGVLTSMSTVRTLDTK